MGNKVVKKSKKPWCRFRRRHAVRKDEDTVYKIPDSHSELHYTTIDFAESASHNVNASSTMTDYDIIISKTVTPADQQDSNDYDDVLIN